MFDTHCHLNFKAFDETVETVIANAHANGVNHITIPGTDIPTSKKAIAIANRHKNIYVAAGIHPHHVYEMLQEKNNNVAEKIKELEELLVADKADGKIVAIGEIGLDRHMYQKTKYGEYIVNEDFIALQKEFFIAQLKLVVTHKKSVVVHNREAKADLLPILREYWDSFFEGHMVLHCAEPDQDLLDFVIEKKIYWGVDGDVTYMKKKKAFISQVPLEQLVLETDSPFLVPEPLKSDKVFPNEPANLKLIAEYVANLRGEDADVLKKQTEENGLRLFMLQS